MRHESIDGVVVRVRDYGDHDRYLSVLTAEAGRITVLSKGGHSLKGPQTAISQLYTYANFEYYRKNGSIAILKGGTPIQPFYALSMDIDRLNLAAYLCDLTCELTDEGEEAGEMLRLLLNSLYAISRDLYPQELIKGAFELRAAVLSGYAPELDACARCGENKAEELYLDVMNGALLCAECLRTRGQIARPDSVYDDLREAEVLCPLSPAAHAALVYAATAPLSRLFSFELADAEDLRLFAAAAETYLLSHVGHGFDTLDFYRSLRMPTKGTKA
jgi:DNA repair protein RecO (recombination protein O)